MWNYRKNDYAANKYSPNIVYRFNDEIIEISLEDYLEENPDRTEQDFLKLKALSDEIYYEQDRAENTQTNLPTHVSLENVPGLAPTSLLLLEQIRTVDRRRLRGYIGHISREKMKEIDKAISVSLGIKTTKERNTHRE